MKLPDTNRKKALVIVDVQPAFISPDNEYAVGLIARLIAAEPYDLYVKCLFNVQPGSLWDKQQNWTMPPNSDISAPPEIDQALEGRNSVTVLKSTRSAFKGDPKLKAVLDRQGIEELHIAGFATHDCVLATAFEAFDLGYPVYVLEELCDAAEHPERHEQGINLLRNQNMTNNSCLAPTKEIAINRPAHANDK